MKRKDSKPSTPIVTTRQMIPVFNVVSELEDARFNNQDFTVTAYDSPVARDVWATGRGLGEKERDDTMQGRAKSKLSHEEKIRNYKAHISKKIKSRQSNLSPEKLNFTANFTPSKKVFDITTPTRVSLFTQTHKDTMKGLDDKSVDNFESLRVNPSDNPVYEDPKDVVRMPKAKRSASDASRLSKEGRSLLKEQKRKLVKKYESLIVGLMDRCEENMTLLNEKQSQMLKMKEKLKVLHTYNNQFADENELLKQQRTQAAAYLAQIEQNNNELERRLSELEAPGQERVPPEVQLVEVCMSCNTREIVERQVKQQNAALQRDMTAMKDVIYRLNLQLSRYQEKLRKMHSENDQLTPNDEALLKIRPNTPKSPVEALDYSSIFDSLNKANLDGIQTTQVDNLPARENKILPGHEDVPSNLNANALAPLFEAYQESIQEKDALILDYEKQFTRFNQKMKHILQQNKCLSDKLAARSEELSSVRDSLKRSAAERESSELDKAALAERTEKAERKLKEVYELYEDKVGAMSRDYELVHGEYSACRLALARAEARLTQLDVGGARTVPADMHERALNDCKRLFEELKYHYGLERDRREEQLAALKQRSEVAEAQLRQLKSEGEKIKGDLKAALKNVRLYRRAAVIFRARLRASVSSLHSLRRSRRRLRTGAAAQLSPELRAALDKVDRIKAEIQTVKGTAYRELAEVERRMRGQQEEAQRASEEFEHDMQRMRLLLEHKERIIRKLIDKVAAVDSLRPSDYNSHRLQGNHPLNQPQTLEPQGARDQAKRGSVRLVPAPGGYFQEARDQERQERRPGPAKN